jgi:hypothetical protein
MRAVTSKDPWAGLRDVVSDVVGDAAKQRNVEMIAYFDGIAGGFRDEIHGLKMQISDLNARLELHESYTDAVIRASKGTHTSLTEARRQVDEACAAATRKSKLQRVDVKMGGATVTAIVRPGADSDIVLREICRPGR